VSQFHGAHILYSDFGFKSIHLRRFAQSPPLRANALSMSSRCALLVSSLYVGNGTATPDAPATLRQILARDDITRTQHHGALNDILQFRTFPGQS
jgi:hypothetical protein